MMKLIVVLLSIQLSTAFIDEKTGTDAVVMQDASKFCITCIGRRTNKPMFINPDNCHQYFSCFFKNATSATGILKTVISIKKNFLLFQNFQLKFF